jgi:hypothetical protein
MQWYTIWVPGWHNAYACCRFGHVPGCAIEGALLTAVAAMFSFFLSQLWKGGICVVVQFMEGTRWRGQDEFVVAGGRWMTVHCFSRWGLCRGAGGFWGEVERQDKDEPGVGSGERKAVRVRRIDQISPLEISRFLG